MRQIRRAIHLDFHTMPGIYDFNKGFDAAKFAQTLADAKVDYINLVAKCNIGFAYYDTAIGIKYPGMKGDMFGDALRECQKRGIGVTAYFNVGLDHEQAFRHREWCIVNDENQVIYGDKTANFFRNMCLNTGYKDYMLDMIKELMDNYRVDGVFLDCLEPFPCYGSECADDIIVAGGSPDDINTVVEHTRSIFLNFCKEVKAIVGDDKYLFLNGMPRDLANDLNTHYDIECLTSTSNWGYETFGANVAYCRNLKDKVSFMTGRFQNNWGDFGGYKGKAALENDIWDAYCNGVYSVSIGDHMHPAENLEPLVYREISEIYADAEKLDEWTVGAVYMAEIGVLMPRDNPRPGKTHRGLARMLSELKTGFEIIDESMDFARFKLLILPDFILVDKVLSEKLTSYIACGGKVISSGISGLNTEKSGFALKEWSEAFIFDGIDRSNSSYFRAENGLDGVLPDMRWAVYDHGILMHTRENTQSFARYIKPYFNRHWDGRHGYFYTPPEKETGNSAVAGCGGIIHICFKVFEAYYNYAVLAHKQLVKYCIDALYPQPLLINVDLPSTARATLTHKGNAVNLHVKVTFPEGRGDKQIIEEHQVLPAGRTVLVRGEYSRAYTAPDKQDIAVNTEQGYTRIILPEIKGYKLIALQP